MVNRGLKTRIPISSTIDIKLNKSLKAIAKETRIPISKLLDEAIDDLIEKYKKYSTYRQQ